MSPIICYRCQIRGQAHHFDGIRPLIRREVSQAIDLVALVFVLGGIDVWELAAEEYESEIRLYYSVISKRIDGIRIMQSTGIVPFQ